MHFLPPSTGRSARLSAPVSARLSGLLFGPLFGPLSAHGAASTGPWLARIVLLVGLSGLVLGPAADPIGAGVEGEFFVASQRVGDQRSPAVSQRAANGEVVVVWVDDELDEVQGQRFDSDGLPVGGQLAISEEGGPRAPSLPRVASDPLTGQFTVTWNRLGNPGSAWAWTQRARTFTADGTPLGAAVDLSGPVHCGHEPLFFESSGEVVYTASGSIVATWTASRSQEVDGEDRTLLCVEARRLDATGAPVGPVIQVNDEIVLDTLESSPRSERQSSVSSAGGSGGFLVTWPANARVWSQLFAADGTPAGPAESTDDLLREVYNLHHARLLDSDGFVVVWSDHRGNQDGDRWAIVGQLADPNGAFVGPQFVVNTTAADSQRYPRVAVDPANSDFLVAWVHPAEPAGEQSPYGRSIRSRRFSSAAVPISAERRLDVFGANAPHPFVYSPPQLAMLPQAGLDQAHEPFVVWFRNEVCGDGDGSAVVGRFRPRTEDLVLSCPLHADDFEFGNTLAWSWSTP